MRGIFAIFLAVERFFISASALGCFVVPCSEQLFLERGLLDMTSIVKLCSAKSDYLGRYYTPQTLGVIFAGLIKKYSARKNISILDLGVGRGDLIKYFNEKSEVTKYFGLDVDEVVIASSEHFLDCDVVSGDIKEVTGCDYASFDIVVSNPPYISVNEKKYMDSILEISRHTGFDFLEIKKMGFPAVTIFFLQALRFVRKNGLVVFIVPDGFISGSEFSSLRDFLCKRFTIEVVLELPAKAFEKTEAKTYIVVLRNSLNTSSEIKLAKVESLSSICYQDDFQVFNVFDLSRWDYTFNSEFLSLKKPDFDFLISDVAISIFRGRKSSAHRKKEVFFHTTDFKAGLPIDSKFLVESDGLHGRVAQKGDILISRVGRNFYEKITIVTKGFVEVSDCIIVLRVEESYQNMVFNFLVSVEGKAQLKLLARGVCAKFISQEKILGIAFGVKPK